MMTLQQWQKSLLSDSVSATLQLQASVRPAGKLSAEQALGVYQNNCLGSRINALVAIYSTCCAVLGEDYFRQLLRPYARMHVANSADLNDYGAGFANFLHKQVKQRSELQSFLYLPDLAVLDKIVHDLHSVMEVRSSDRALLVHADSLIYQHSPLLHLMRFHFPVDKVWQANHQLDSGSVSEDDIAPYCVAIQRKEYRIEIQRIEQQEYEMLSSLHKQSIGELAEQDVAKLPKYLPRWIQSDWLRWELP